MLVVLSRVALFGAPVQEHLSRTKCMSRSRFVELLEFASMNRNSKSPPPFPPAATPALLSRLPNTKALSSVCWRSAITHGENCWIVTLLAALELPPVLSLSTLPSSLKPCRALTSLGGVRLLRGNKISTGAGNWSAKRRSGRSLSFGRNRCAGGVTCQRTRFGVAHALVGLWCLLLRDITLSEFFAML